MGVNLEFGSFSAIPFQLVQPRPRFHREICIRLTRPSSGNKHDLRPGQVFQLNKKSGW